MLLAARLQFCPCKTRAAYKCYARNDSRKPAIIARFPALLTPCSFSESLLYDGNDHHRRRCIDFADFLFFLMRITTLQTMFDDNCRTRATHPEQRDILASIDREAIACRQKSAISSMGFRITDNGLSLSFPPGNKTMKVLPVMHCRRCYFVSNVVTPSQSAGKGCSRK